MKSVLDFGECQIDIKVEVLAEDSHIRLLIFEVDVKAFHAYHFVREFHIVIQQDHAGNHSNENFGKGFPQADPSSPQKRPKAHWMAFLVAVWFEIEFGVGIESLGQELMRLLPLLWVEMEGEYVYLEVHIFFDVVLAYLLSFCQYHS